MISEPDTVRNHLRLVGIVTFLTASSLAIYGSLTYFQYQETFARFYVDGLILMWLIALWMAIVATPFFASSVIQNPDDAPKDLRESIALVLGVGGITFLALCVVFLGLWVLGWCIELIRTIGILLKRAILG